MTDQTLNHHVLTDATTDLLDQVFMLGFDVWSDGQSSCDYIASCRSSAKYQQGAWHVLHDGETILAALILYDAGFGLPTDACGIGSLATMPALRNNGMASALLSGVLSGIDANAPGSIYLFADIEPAFYERFGFIRAGASLTATAKGPTVDAICMVRPIADTSISMPARLPDYF